MRQKAKLIYLNTGIDLMEEANEFISKGYRYQGLSPQLINSNINHQGIMYFEKTENGSVVHIWELTERNIRSKNINEILNKIIRYENNHGFDLIDIISINSFSKRDSKTLTDRNYLVFHHDIKKEKALMLDKWIMKKERKITDKLIKCPVKGCTYKVPRMNGANSKRANKKSNDLLCPHHRIFISPTTFEYENKYMSILWHKKKEMDLLKKIKSVNNSKNIIEKIGREHEEDSLTWNVFRYMERNQLLNKFIKNNNKDKILPELDLDQDTTKVHYWGIDSNNKEPWKPLVKASKRLKRGPTKRLEPDIIIEDHRKVIFILVKFKASVLTQKEGNPDYYEDNNNIFKEDLKKVYYKLGFQLLKFYLLGSEVSKITNKKFKLILITQNTERLQEINKNINEVIRNHNQFSHVSWKALLSFIKDNKADYVEKKIIKRYLKGKTVGYKNEILKPLKIN